jgi:hypothetical protein
MHPQRSRGKQPNPLILEDQIRSLSLSLSLSPSCSTTTSWMTPMRRNHHVMTSHAAKPSCQWPLIRRNKQSKTLPSSMMTISSETIMSWSVVRRNHNCHDQPCGENHHFMTSPCGETTRAWPAHHPWLPQNWRNRVSPKCTSAGWHSRERISINTWTTLIRIKIRIKV